MGARTCALRRGWPPKHAGFGVRKPEAPGVLLAGCSAARLLSFYLSSVTKVDGTFEPDVGASSRGGPRPRRTQEKRVLSGAPPSAVRRPERVLLESIAISSAGPSPRREPSGSFRTKSDRVVVSSKTSTLSEGSVRSASRSRLPFATPRRELNRGASSQREAAGWTRGAPKEPGGEGGKTWRGARAPAAKGKGRRRRGERKGTSQWSVSERRAGHKFRDRAPT